MITYDPFWQLLARTKTSQYRLIRYYKLSASQINRLKNNLPVSTETIRQICEIFNCGVYDVMRFVSEEQPARSPALLP